MINKKMKEFGINANDVNFKANLANAKITIEVSSDTPNLKFEYHLYNGSILMDKITYSLKTNVSFKLTDFGSYRIKVFVKEQNSKKSTYSFFTDFLKFNELSAIKTLSPKEEDNDSVNSISSIILNKYRTEMKINNIIEKLFAIQSMNFSIIKYFKSQGINQISLYGYKDEVILSKLLWINMRFEDEFKIKYLLTDTPFAYETSVPRKMELKFRKIDANEKFSKEDIIIICSSQKNEDEIAKIQLETKANVIHITELIGKIFISQYIEKPLKELKQKNPDVSFIVCLPPDISKIKNKSANEEDIIKNKISLKSIRENLNSNKPVIPASLKRFSTNLNYIKDVMGAYYLTEKDNVLIANDFQSKYVNVVNNFRLTVDQPNNYTNTIYLFGNSITFGLGSSDEDTIPSILQRTINNNKIKYRVVNCSNHVSSDYDYQFKLMNKIDLKPNDIVISVMSMNVKEDEDYIIDRTQSLFNRPHDLGEIFIDRTHINKVGNDLIANSLYNTMKKNRLFTNRPKKCEHVEKQPLKVETNTYDGVERKELDEFLTYLKANKYNNKTNNIGAVVMNCNPFTLGHKYLVEYAAKNVEHLYIFVVEEDKSFFPFKDRFKLVKEGTKDIPNVTVLPSGKFIISSVTFSDYFNKEKVENKEINMSEDVMIFAKEIAPTLNITKRFVGDEPKCNVTRQYNNTLKDLLPKYGVNLTIIPRKNKSKKPISATDVRMYLKEKNFEEISKIVPKSTLDYLKKMN